MAHSQFTNNKANDVLETSSGETEQHSVFLFVQSARASC